MATQKNFKYTVHSFSRPFLLNINGEESAPQNLIDRSASYDSKENIREVGLLFLHDEWPNLLKIEAQIVHNAAENLGSFVDVVNDYHYSLPFKGSLQKSGDLKSSYCKLKQANATYGLMWYIHPVRNIQSLRSGTHDEISLEDGWLCFPNMLPGSL